jgi:hypothetical protein
MPSATAIVGPLAFGSSLPNLCAVVQQCQKMPVEVPGHCLSLASADFTIIKGPFSCSEQKGKNDLYKF